MPRRQASNPQVVVTQEIDAVAAATREVLRDIWPDDPKKADALMRHLTDAHANTPAHERNAAILYNAMKLASLLTTRIQRE